MPPPLERFKLYSVVMDVEDDNRILGFWEDYDNARVVYICLNQENYQGKNDLYNDLRSKDILRRTGL